MKNDVSEVGISCYNRNNGYYSARLETAILNALPSTIMSPRNMYTTRNTVNSFNRMLTAYFLRRDKCVNVQRGGDRFEGSCCVTSSKRPRDAISE